MAKSWDFTSIAQKWAQQMGGPQAQANYKAGIMGLTVSPTQLAATDEAEARYINGVQQSVSSGKRRTSLQAVSLGEYQQKATTKGAANLGIGANLAKDRYAKSMAKYPAVYAQIQSQLQGMPKGGAAAAVARASVVITELMRAAGRA